MLVLGFNAFNHDSSIALVKDGNLIYHKQTEDFTEALSFGKPDHIAYYERPYLKKLRHLYAGQYSHAFSFDDLPTKVLKKYKLSDVPLHYVDHHLSHAASAVYQTNSSDCCVIVADAIGEWDTVTVWKYDGSFTKVVGKRYPYSLGIFYSAFTKLLGLQPMRDENKLMQMSVDGDYLLNYTKVKKYFYTNLHRGVHGWGDVVDPNNIAASVQHIFEDELRSFLQLARKHSNKLVFTGGCAYNKLSHAVLGEYFDDYAIPKLAGDVGSSIGAAKIISKT